LLILERNHRDFLDAYGDAVAIANSFDSEDLTRGAQLNARTGLLERDLEADRLERRVGPVGLEVRAVKTEVACDTSTVIQMHRHSKWVSHPLTSIGMNGLLRVHDRNIDRPGTA
jgi:hypothetical protein